MAQKNANLDLEAMAASLGETLPGGDDDAGEGPVMDFTKVRGPLGDGRYLVTVTEAKEGFNKNSNKWFVRLVYTVSFPEENRGQTTEADFIYLSESTESRNKLYVLPAFGLENHIGTPRQLARAMMGKELVIDYELQEARTVNGREYAAKMGVSTYTKFNPEVGFVPAPPKQVPAGSIDDLPY